MKYKEPPYQPKFHKSLNLRKSDIVQTIMLNTNVFTTYTASLIVFMSTLHLFSLNAVDRKQQNVHPARTDRVNAKRALALDNKVFIIYISI